MRSIQSPLQGLDVILGDIDRWLCSDAVVDACGAVSSWSNPAHRGYPYPEAAGLWLAYFCEQSNPPPAVHRVASWLCGVIRADGGVGRGPECSYLFDTAVVLEGLVAYAGAAIPDGQSESGLRGSGTCRLDHAIGRLRDFIGRCLTEETAVWPVEARSPRWSRSFTPHLLKVIRPLQADASRCGQAVDPGLLLALSPLATSFARLDPCPVEPVYLHPFCYALEGLCLLANRTWSIAIRHGVDLLSMVQRPSGGLPAFGGRGGGIGPSRCDVTAQAIRLWLLIDAVRYEDAVRAAFAFLAGEQRTAGGLRYEPGSGDTNTWGTLFTAQAIRWYTQGTRLAQIL